MVKRGGVQWGTAGKDGQVSLRRCEAIGCKVSCGLVRFGR